MALRPKEVGLKFILRERGATEFHLYFSELKGKPEVPLDTITTTQKCWLSLGRRL